MATQRTTNKPPIWFGIIFIVAGLIPLFVGKPSPGVPLWVAQVSACIFIFAGVGLICQSLGKLDRANLAWVIMAIAFLTVFNWVGFGPGERKGSVGAGGGGVSVRQGGMDVRIPFAIAAGVMDLIVAFCLLNAVKKKIKQKS